MEVGWVDLQCLSYTHMRPYHFEQVLQESATLVKAAKVPSVPATRSQLACVAFALQGRDEMNLSRA